MTPGEVTHRITRQRRLVYEVLYRAGRLVPTRPSIAPDRPRLVISATGDRKAAERALVTSRVPH